MELGAFVALGLPLDVLGLAGTILPEILCRLGHYIFEEFERYSPKRIACIKEGGSVGVVGLETTSRKALELHHQVLDRALGDTSPPSRCSHLGGKTWMFIRIT